MRLDGIHHVTAITADGQKNVDFYAGVLGLRLVKKTVNQDQTSVYHLFFADEDGDPGSDITFFEFPGSPPGRAGAGMVHRIGWRVASAAALDFWAERLAGADIELDRADDEMTFEDPEGLGHVLVVNETEDEPLVADHSEISAEHALQGFDHVRAYSISPDESKTLLEDTLGFEPFDDGSSWEARGERRGSRYIYDDAPQERGLHGAGSVHHVAWASQPDDISAWRDRVRKGGARPTEVIDRFYFKSVYFREPSGVLFEIATIGPGFTIDEPLESLGQKLSLPPAFEHLREQVEPGLKPITNPRD